MAGSGPRIISFSSFGKLSILTLAHMFSQFRYHPRDPSMNSETYHYKRGANQTFSQSTHILDPSKFPEEEVWIICCILRVVIIPQYVSIRHGGVSKMIVAEMYLLIEFLSLL